MPDSEAVNFKHLIWHDITCPEGEECRSRVLHAASDNLVRAGLIDRFAELYEKRSPARPFRIDSENFEHRPCDRVEGTATVRQEAHGGHNWEDFETWDTYWCEGLPAHPNTAIGKVGHVDLLEYANPDCSDCRGTGGSNLEPCKTCIVGVWG